MNILLVIRSEILAIFILIFLIIYDRICARYRDGKDQFTTFALAALGHAVMGLVTEITVNDASVPAWLNDTFHVFFFAFALLFSLKYFQYVLTLIMPKSNQRMILIPSVALAAVCILIMIFSPIDYLQGNGTKYSAGTGPTLCYMLGFVFFVIADVLILAKRKHISSHIVHTVLPISLIGLSIMGIQIVVPEFLFTGCDLTLISVGVFFALENPIGKFRDRALVDLDTQVWNRNCYEIDTTHFIARLLEDPEAQLSYILCDINGLKQINDNEGHLEGDKVIDATARILEDSLPAAFRIYRIGGDEFAAFFLHSAEEDLQAGMARIESNSGKYNEKNRVPVHISVGHSVRKYGESLQELVKAADLEMYRVKEEWYRKTGNERRK